MEQERRKFSPLRFYRINIIFLIIIAVAAVLVFFILACNVTRVVVKGATFYDDSEIESMVLNDRYKTNGAWDVVKNTVRKRRDIPFVDSVSVRLSGMHTVVITVKEKDIVGYISDDKDNTNVYLDRDGRVTDLNAKLLTGMIPVKGLSTKKKIVEGGLYPAPENRVSALSLIFKSKDNMDLSPDEICFGDSGQITMKFGKVTAQMGTADGLKDKLLRLSYILPKVKGQSGILHFENYTSDNTDIVFEAR